MLRQNLLLSLLLVSFMLSSHASTDPAAEGCIKDGSDSIGQLVKVKSDGKCRQPFEATLVVKAGKNYWIYTEMTAAPIDESIIQYSFGPCDLKLKAFNQNGKIWFEPVSDPGKQIEPGFRISIQEYNYVGDTVKVMKKEEDKMYYQIACNKIFEGLDDDFNSMHFKQEIEIGDPNIALVLNKESGYFGAFYVRNRNFFGNLPPQLSTTTTVASTTSMTSSTVATTTKAASTTTSMKSSIVATTTKSGSSSAKAVSSSTLSSSKASSTVATISSETATEEKGMEPWLIGLIIGVPVLLLIVIAVIIAVICIVRRRKKKEKPQVVDVVFKTEEEKTRETTHGGEAGKSKKKSKESNKSVSKSLFGSMEKA